MDIVTLLAWRSTSRANYVDACREMHTSLSAILQSFVPNPDVLLGLITDCRALLSGQLALAYLLRDPAVVPYSVDIYVGDLWFDKFMDRFHSTPDLNDYESAYTMLTHHPAFTASRHITHTVELYLSTGRTIFVHASASVSACHALVCSPTSAGFTFITAQCFATAYPMLTMNRRAMVSLERAAMSATSDRLFIQWLEAHRFILPTAPSEWWDYSGATHVESSSDIRRDHCLAVHREICPFRARYFGDQHSFINFIDVLDVDYGLLRSMSVPPYGIMAAWRLPCRDPCQMDCDRLDDLLMHLELISTVIFQTDVDSLGTDCDAMLTNTADPLSCKAQHTNMYT
ncbi:hypothetical protein GSI_12243 [Ganoderma sinense ZZ0214-1]|uniref:Uncharacterized protein n=1 Tax=Ganoderma sinense ZZ0214-1 TaxID=1077348 RepID=A0A2G8RYA0_9APHY|nr:hypothetical protein GSI_12243 [Ganoderma sinense ZZ0214-1]